MDKDLLNLIIPTFNILAGIIGLLIGFQQYKPFRKEVAENYHKKYGIFFKLGGIGMLLWGIVNLLMMFS